MYLFLIFVYLFLLVYVEEMYVYFIFFFEFNLDFVLFFEILMRIQFSNIQQKIEKKLTIERINAIK